MSGFYLEKRNPKKNEQRFYRVLLAPTLFAEWAVIREWGRIGCPGTIRETWFASEEAARAEQDKLLRRKLRRGYQPLESTPQR